MNISEKLKKLDPKYYLQSELIYTTSTLAHKLRDMEEEFDDSMSHSIYIVGELVNLRNEYLCGDRVDWKELYANECKRYDRRKIRREEVDILLSTVPRIMIGVRYYEGFFSNTIYSKFEKDPLVSSVRESLSVYLKLLETVFGFNIEKFERVENANLIYQTLFRTYLPLGNAKAYRGIIDASKKMYSFLTEDVLNQSPENGPTNNKILIDTVKSIGEFIEQVEPFIVAWEDKEKSIAILHNSIPWKGRNLPEDYELLFEVVDELAVMLEDIRIKYNAYMNKSELCIDVLDRLRFASNMEIDDRTTADAEDNAYLERSALIIESANEVLMDGVDLTREIEIFQKYHSLAAHHFSQRLGIDIIQAAY
jgi:hypothetical protein